MLLLITYVAKSGEERETHITMEIWKKVSKNAFKNKGPSNSVGMEWCAQLNNVCLLAVCFPLYSYVECENPPLSV